VIIGIINDAVIRTHKIVTKTYLLLRYWVLFKYSHGSEIPKITTDLIKVAIQVICSPKDAQRKTKNKEKDNPAGLQKKKNKDQWYDELKKLNPFEMENNQYLSSILDYQCVMILTAIENNIKHHFVSYVKRYVNVMLMHQHIGSLIDVPKKKQFLRDIGRVKSDLLENLVPSQYTSDLKFHDWIHQQHDNILPKIEHGQSYYYDVHVSPDMYLKYMIHMNKEIEKIGGHMFQMLPLRDSIIPNHIQIDTKAIVELLIDKGNGYLLKTLDQYQDVIWQTYFKNLPHRKGYLFDHAIVTDGFSVSICLIHEQELVKKKILQQRKLEGRCLAKEYREKGIDRPVKEKKTRPSCQKPPAKIPEFPYIDEVS